MNLENLNKEIQALKVGEVLTKKNVPDHIYHATDGIGSSGMREAVKSMAHYKLYCERDKRPTPEMQIGSAIHTLVLEPDLFFDRFVLPPKDLTPGNNKAWKEWKVEQALSIITRNDMEVIQATTDSVMARAYPYFSDGESEISYWTLDKSGLILKARVDYLKGDLGVDLKSTKAETPYKFLNTIKYDYAIQDAHYRRVTGLSDFIFIGACKKPPHAIYAAKQSDDLRGKANKLIDAAINSIKTATEFDDYPLPPVEIMETQ